MAKIILTDKQLALMCPSLTPSRRAEILTPYNNAMERFGINTSVFRIAAFFSNLMHESKELSTFSENLNYSASRLREVFPKYFPSFAFAQAYAGNAEKIANRVYANRLGNGNEASGDGWKYRGGGGIQRTGKDNYRRGDDALKIPLLSNPQLLQKPEYAALSDCLFWSDKGLNRLADCLTGKRDANEYKTLRAICKRINGGYNGWTERERLYWRVLAILQRSVVTNVVTHDLNTAIIANPNIPEIQNSEALKEKTKLSPSSETHIIAEQEKATKAIDYAESVPPSVARGVATGLWSRTGGRVISGMAWFFALLQAGNLGAWAVFILLAIGVIVFVYSQRQTFKRWYNLGVLFVKDFIQSFASSNS